MQGEKRAAAIARIPMKLPAGSKTPVALLIYLLLHVVLDHAARVFEVSPGVSLWYPPVGLSFAVVVIFGWRAMPAVFVAHLYSAYIGSVEPGNWLRYTLPVVISISYASTALVARRMFGPNPRPVKPFDTGVFIAILLSGPLLASLTGSLLVLVSGFSTPDGFARMAFSWWIGDLTGVLTVVPLMLVHFAPWLLGESRPTKPVRTWRYRAEVTLQAAALLGCVWAVNGAEFLRGFHAYYLAFVPLIWICLRHGMHGATLATCALTMSSLAAVRVFGGSEDVVVDLLLFVASISGVGLGLGIAVTRRAEAEADRSRLLTIIEAAPDFVVTTGQGGQVLYANLALARFRGHRNANELKGARMHDFHPTWATELILREGVPTAFREGFWRGETALIDADGREVAVSQLIFAHYDQAGQPSMLSAIMRDITAQKQAEQARLETERNLLQAQKLESLGVLAGGIAHDFNNLLTAMLGNATLARLDVPADSPAEKSIHQIELAALRAAELCKQMLAYSGRSRITSSLVDLSKLVQDTTHLLQVSIPKKCTLEFALEPHLPAVEGDSTQLSQIAMNLVINAADAIGDRPGHIVVRTGSMHADRAYLATTYLAPDLDPGHFVFLEVSDNGCGMTQEVLTRIFEPFFTTKFTGHGLGLSAVLGIARGHQGAVKVDTAPGRGTTFRLLLPAAATEPAPAAEEEKAEDSWRGSGRVLIADDEDAVRDISVRILDRAGFTVVAVGNGHDAVTEFRKSPNDFCAVLLDLMMPVMDGEEAYREIRVVAPQTPVLLMSGYSESVSTERFAGMGLAGFVQKPFESARLVAALRTAIEGTEAEKK